MADQQFCLRWNNHQSTLISVFDTLLENGTLVDCTLAAEGQYLKAHKVVLSACSPYLEALLSLHYEKHPIVILKDVKYTELKSMMDYMYRGEVNISQDQLGTFLKAAESLQIKGLSDNGADGDARDVGSTPKAAPASRKTTTQPAISTRPAELQRPEVAPESPNRSRDGSISPSSRKRRRIRRNSQGDDSLADSHLDTSNSCDLPSQAQSTPIVPNIPATVTSSVTTTPIKAPIVKPEQTELVNRIDTNINSLPPESGLLKEKIEPLSEPLLEPKTEYLDDMNTNDDSVEDLTLDDDDDMDGMDISNMSNMTNMSRPGPSHGNELSNQGFTPWHLGGNQTGTDEVFMAAQEAVGAHRDSQDMLTNWRNVRSADCNNAPITADNNQWTFHSTKLTEAMENHGSTERPRSTTQNPHPDEIMMPSSTAENQTRLVALSSEAESIPEKKACKEPPPYICFKCGNKFKFHHTLETHLEFHCKKSPRVKPRRSLNSKSLSDRYYCRKKTCNRSFSSEKSLIRHSRDCRASKAHACKFCDLRFTWKTQCQKHIFRKHSDQLEPEEENKENQSAIPLQASVSELEQQIPGVPEDDSLDPVPIQSVNNTCINEEENKVNNTLKRILSTDKPTVLSKKPSKAKGRSKEKNSNRNGEGGMKIVDESVSNVETETERDQTGQEMIVCCEAESGEGPSEGKAFYHPLIGEHRGEAMENPQMKSDSVKITCPECDRFVCSDYFDLHLKLICFHTHKYQYFSCHRCVDGHCMPMKEYLLHLHLEHGETLTLRDIEQLTKS